MSTARTDQIASLYREQARRLIQVTASRSGVRDRDLIEDACQTAWTRLVDHAEVSLDDRAAFAWLLTTAIRQARHLAQRTQTAAEELPEAATNIDPARQVIARDQLASLGTRQHAFLELQDAGYSYQEISDLAGDSVRTVQRQLERAREKIRKEGG